VSSPVVRLAGMDREAIVRALQEFRAGARAGTIMDRIAKGFTDDEIRALAAWFAAQPK
jgi:sulfide dehydrogenase cytochrome subunit